MDEFLSIGELGDELGIQGWRIARLFELRVLPDPPRLAGRRLIPRASVPAIVAALRDRGWLPAGHNPDGSGSSVGSGIPTA